MVGMVPIAEHFRDLCERIDENESPFWQGIANNTITTFELRRTIMISEVLHQITSSTYLAALRMLDLRSRDILEKPEDDMENPLLSGHTVLDGKEE